MTYDLDEALPGSVRHAGDSTLGAEEYWKRKARTPPGRAYWTRRAKCCRWREYVPSRFLLSGEGEEQYEQQNAGLLRSALLKRFESSAHAFRRTVEKMTASHDQFLSALDARGRCLPAMRCANGASSDVD